MYCVSEMHTHLLHIHLQLKLFRAHAIIKSYPRDINSCTQHNLEKLQIEAGRIVTGLPLFASRQSIYSETGWELLFDRRRVRRLSLFYSIHNKSAPDYLCDFMPVGSVSQYNLRNINNYVLPNCRLEITKKSFFPFTTRDWNNLSPEIRNSGNINIFKRKIRILLEKCLFTSVGVIEN
jgi:hypothetical protein